MIRTVIKRDGREVDFDVTKIEVALQKAFQDVARKEQNKATEVVKDSYLIKKISEKIADSPVESLTVEEIQDMVELELMNSCRKDVAKAYILYRNERTRIRNNNSALMRVVSEKLSATNVQNQNANVDEHSFGGRIGEADSELMKQYALDNCMSEQSKQNHLNNEVYIHDLDKYAVGEHNCLSVPFDDLLKNGFNTRQTDVRPPQSVSTAFQLVAVIFQLQSLQQFGGCSATHLDWTMIPFVRKSFAKHFKDGLNYIEHDDARYWFNLGNPDISIENNYYKSNKVVYKYAIDMTVRETRQAIEGMYHNLNTLQSRSGNQLPFTSINYGTCTEPEGRLITRLLLEVLIDGNGKLHRTPIFPCGIFQYMKGVNDNPNTPNYDLFRLALKATSLRLYPNYANVDWSGNVGYDPSDPRTFFSTMGCRTANGWDINGFGQLKDGRGNICPVTIILPTLAMEAKNTCKKTHFTDGSSVAYNGDVVSRFIEILDQKIHEAKDMLLERFEWIAAQNPLSAKFMYENGLMAGYVPEEGIRSALKHGTLAIGQLGLAEALQILIGCDHTTEYGMNVAKEIEGLFKTRCAEFKQEYSLNFGVYYTPAENLCYTAMKKFRDKYGVIKNVSDKDFFTNSMHVPVWKEMTPFEKIDIESQLTGFSSAGCITYVELPSSAKHNIDAIETIVKYAMNKDIPYFAINVPNDTCMNCGYSDEIASVCPVCGSDNIQRLRRVTGYLTGDYKTAFNYGKQKETEMRVKHIQ